MNDHDHEDADEVVRLLRQVLRDDDGDIPADLQPPTAFWDRLAAARTARAEDTPDQPDLAAAQELHDRSGRARRTHILLAMAACAALIVGATAALYLARGDRNPSATAAPSASVRTSSPQQTPALTYALYKPAGYPDSTCVPGAIVHPTRTPSAAADTFRASLDPNTLTGGDDRAIDPRQPFVTKAFEPISEVGGCVQAWIEPRGPIPSDATPFTVNGIGFYQRLDDNGLTEVYLDRNQTLYVAASGNAAPHALAVALDASTTTP